jgi:hypothetical protein
MPRPINPAAEAALDHPETWYELPGAKGLTHYYRTRGFEVVTEDGVRYIRWRKYAS